MSLDVSLSVRTSKAAKVSAGSLRHTRPGNAPCPLLRVGFIGLTPTPERALAPTDLGTYWCGGSGALDARARRGNAMVYASSKESGGVQLGATQPVAQLSPQRRWAGRAKSIAIIVAILVIVAASAIIIKARGGDWWAPALPPLGAFSLLLLGVMLKRPDDTLGFAIGEMVDLPARQPVWGTVVALLASLFAALLVYVARAEVVGEQDYYSVQLFETTNVPDKRIAGVTVVMERRRGSTKAEELRQVSNADGIASFPVEVNDSISLRLERNSEDGIEVISINDGDLLEAVELQRTFPVRLDNLPPDQWTLVSSKTSDLRADDDGVVGFMRADHYLFRWSDGMPRAPALGPDGIEAEIAPFGVPQAEIVIRRPAYVLGFSPYLRLPRWAASRVSSEPPVRRQPDQFLADPLVPIGVQARVDDYANNPFDRGHLVRRSDVATTQQLSASINLMTVVTPQTTLFNQKVWLAIENHATQLGKTEGHDVFIIRGPLFLPQSGNSDVNLRLIGPGRLAVPTHFFQLMLDRTARGLRMECHMVPNQSIFNELPSLDQATIVERYRARLATIEQTSGLRFFPGLNRASAPGC
jgi:endonuclease G, mitochondrial